ncbi:ral guanine nucleotide dissociation stimulator-like isoform X2 [Tamandua tetradactyla]|uniref:ral guanine nucleotide dissociation stimulator-like isoform X2 n=1 Tax=Tamandua tetradactyla TaxID=48850 RepID=UPI004053ECD5
MPGEASACLFSSLKIGDLTFSDRPQPGAPLSAHRASGPLPLFNKQVVDSCIIHISLDGDHGNVPKSIVITCHDRALAVILKAMDEYHLDLEAAKYYKLVQIISPDRSPMIFIIAGISFFLRTVNAKITALCLAYGGH